MAALTAIGLALRIWPVGRLGMNHFDEGIYAFAASWSLLQGGLTKLDPQLIPYAPPGYTVLGGIAYWLLGRSDGSMIAVSQITGALTIPVVAWLARRTFGAGAGFAASAFCAFSGPHIAFSRMALTDVSFLLVWLLAIGAGMRFLERPGFARALLMGLAVGLAQQFKYNGWLTGGIVAASAAWGILIRPEERSIRSILGTFGWGVVAAGVAWLVVWPWYAFVEAHGGYSALLHHQRSYLGGWSDWGANFLVQLDQAVAMIDVRFVGISLAVVALTSWVARSVILEQLIRDVPTIRRVTSSMRFAIGTVPYIIAPYWLGLVMAPWLLSWRRVSTRVLGVWWLVLSALSPFYHPYARLWLPYHAVNWTLIGWLVTHRYAAWIESAKPSPRLDLRKDKTSLTVTGGWLLHGVFGLGFLVFIAPWQRQAFPQPGLLAPSDSLHQATVQVSEALPEGVKQLRLLARPSVTYYLAGRVTLYPMAGSAALLDGGNNTVWALVDSAILRSEAVDDSERSGTNLPSRFAKRWEVVGTFPTNPNLPTLLDLDPGAVRSSSRDRTYPLWLLRPRTSKAPP